MITCHLDVLQLISAVLSRLAAGKPPRVRSTGPSEEMIYPPIQIRRTFPYTHRQKREMPDFGSYPPVDQQCGEPKPYPPRCQAFRDSYDCQ